MRLLFFYLLCITGLAGFASSSSSSAGNYNVRLLQDGSVEVASGGSAAVRFDPEFVVMYSAERVLQLRQRMGVPHYHVTAWQRRGERNIITNPFEVTTPVYLRAVSAADVGGTIRWNFPVREDFKLEAELRPSPTGREPRLYFRLTAIKPGQYSVGFAGAPSCQADQADAIWQPLVWHERRFPEESYLTLEYNCPIPTTLVSRNGLTYGVMADPGQLPFRIPNLRNNLFGVTVRNEKGLAQPMLFAPVLGTDGSQLEKNESFDFQALLFVQPSSWNVAFEYAAREILGFHDYRQNTDVSLNKTFENMVDYALSGYSRFLDDERGSSYATDMPGAVKNVSALCPLGLALVTDNEELFLKRVKPLLEYLLSREKFLFSPLGEVGSQIATSNMRGPSATVSELAVLHAMSGGRNPFLLDYVRELYPRDRVLNMEKITYGGTWQRDLSLYRATGDKKHLDDASRKADIYIRERIDNPPSDFEEAVVYSHFWDDILPLWVDLFELYELTLNPRHLQASLKGARQHASIIWFYPQIPDRDVLVNEGGFAPQYRQGEPTPVPEARVPAWRVSEMGLIAEGIATSGGAHRGLFINTYAPYFLRLAHYTGDQFLHDIARSAVIGRYTNFPGYHMNLAYSTAHEAVGFPLRPHGAITSTSMHYNHILVHSRKLLDYLVSDAFYRSEGAIDFPSRFVEGYAYLYGKIYGEKPGRFYGDQNVTLWMPKGILNIDHVQANYLTATGNGKLYIALKNQSSEDIEATVSVNPEIVAGARSGRFPVKLWKNNRDAGTGEVRNGQIRVSIPANGITALIVEGLEGNIRFSDKMVAHNADGKLNGFAETDTPIGTIQGMYVGTPTGMFLSFGEYNWAYGYLAGEFEDLHTMESVTFHYRFDEGPWQVYTDNQFPWEFSVPAGRDVQQMEFYISTRTPASKQELSERLVVRRFEARDAN